MTEIPEHLLKRSQAARSKAGGEAAPPDGAGEAPAAAVAKAAAPAAPAVPAAPAAPPAPVVKPDSPVVAAYKARRKVPVWAMMTLAILPVWGFMYARALTPQPKVVEGPLGVGATEYGICASCHLADGSGAPGGAYGFLNGDAKATFPHIEDQLRWVYFGSVDYTAAGVTIPGDPKRAGGPHVIGAVAGVMPAQGAALTPAQLLAVVCHERYTLGGLEHSGAEWDKWCSPDAPAWVAAESGTPITNLHTAVDGAIEIGNAPKPGSSPAP